MTLFITQCPHCGTSFRTRINQLQSAEGVVRCGACLKVFVADDNLIPSAELHTVSLPAEPEEESLHPLFGEEDVAAPDALGPQHTDADNDIQTLDLADSLPGRITPSISEYPVWEILGEAPPAGNDDDRQEDKVEVDAGMNATRDAGLAVDAIAAIQIPVEEVRDNDPGFGAEHLAALGKADEVLELDWRQPPRRGPVLWPYAVLLVVALMGQFVYYEFDMLSRNTHTRPWVQRSCDLLGCQLPGIIDVAAIRSDNLQVRSHPQYSNALNVAMTVRNSASYPQPFPALNLKFSNVRNEAVATRSFMPAEYLPEGLSENTLMPVNAPVQINLDILDPGIEAVNYEVSFSPNPPL